jgi:endonuclease-3 related protein
MLNTLMDFSPTRRQLLALYHGMLDAYGPQQWWPADSPFEVAVGAILTQNTNWSNVERAIARLREAGALSLAAILDLPQDRLAELIRPSGYFNIKARRLRALCRFLQDVGGLEGLARRPLDAARTALLAVKGVGPETADDILLYALERPVFVIDVYTRRLLARHGLISGVEDYESLRRGIERALGPDVALFKEYHALIVAHAKVACRKRPVCGGCCLAAGCARRLDSRPEVGVGRTKA